MKSTSNSVGRFDLDALKQVLADRAFDVASSLLPKGKKNGNYWTAGDITGGPGKSFKICLSGEHAGVCKDWADSGKAGSLIDVCMAVRGCNFSTAAGICAELAGRSDLAPAANGVGKVNGHTPTKTFDWEVCKAALGDEPLAKFAAWRGFTVKHCERLRSEGLLGLHTGHIALPVRDQHGNCVGAQYFPDGSRGFYEGGGTAHPLIIGNIKSAKRVYCFESPWDAFAYYAVRGLGATEAMISTRGVNHADKLAGRVPESAELVVFRQNDEPDAKGKIADETWFAKVMEVLDRPMKSVRVPSRLKDLNDWTREGASVEDIQSAIDGAESFGVIEGRPLMELANTYPDPRRTLLGNRWLCVGGSALFVGPSGIGKSSASAQQDILWSLGREAFGITPPRPLRILTVQAENDDGDLGEMARGVCLGLNLSREDVEAVNERVIYVTDNRRNGPEFLGRLRKLIQHWRPDIVRIDPFQAYAGGDVVDPDVTKAFLREGLNPLLDDLNCGAVLCHHTPKATRDTSTWRGSDWMYAGAGNADVTNWARAILVIDPTHAGHVFKFIVAKRGGRSGWKDDEGNTEVMRHFCHASDGLYWREATQEDVDQVANAAPAAKGRKEPEKTKHDLLALVPQSGSVSKNALITKAKESGIAYHPARLMIDALVEDGSLHIWRKPRPRTNPEIYLSRHPEPLPTRPAGGDQ